MAPTVDAKRLSALFQLKATSGRAPGGTGAMIFPMWTRSAPKQPLTRAVQNVSAALPAAASYKLTALRQRGLSGAHVAPRRVDGVALPLPTGWWMRRRMGSVTPQQSAPQSILRKVPNKRA